MSIPGPASPPVLSLRSVSKAYGAVQALRDVSVEVENLGQVRDLEDLHLRGLYPVQHDPAAGLERLVVRRDEHTERG